MRFALLPISALFTLSALAQGPINTAALSLLFEDAKAQHSNALFVYSHGIPLRQQFFDSADRRIYLYSVTKVFTGLAVGLAYDKGLIPSIDEPLSTWYPQLAADPVKSRLKLRHVLQHTSGIFTTQGSHDIYPQKNFVKFALESPIVTKPGEVFQYNNRAINIASGIVGKVTGNPMEKLLVIGLLQPLGISDYKFRRDGTGNTWAMDGLELRVRDLVKVGSVLAEGGLWNGKRILSEKWLAVATEASLVSLDRNGAYGAGIFVLEPDARLVIPEATVQVLEKSEFSASLTPRFRALAGKEFKGAKALGGALKESFSLAELETISSIAGREMIPIYRVLNGRRLLAHSGEIGEYLLALPGSGIAVARTIDDKRGRAGDYGFEKIYRRVLDLVPE